MAGVRGDSHAQGPRARSQEVLQRLVLSPWLPPYYSLCMAATAALIVFVAVTGDTRSAW
eukprot:gene1960-7296_t